MQVSVQQLDPCKVELNIEVEPQKVAQTVEQVYGEFAKRAEVPGFRKGKTPRPILERYVSPESVRRRALDLMMPEAYREALQETGIRPYAEPELEVVQLDTEGSFVFKALVPLPPIVELGEYKEIEVEREEVVVTNDDVETELRALQERQAPVEKVEDRGVRSGDLVVAEVVSAIEGQQAATPRRTLIRVGTNPPEFDANLLGLKTGEEKGFGMTYPNDFAEEALAGKRVDYQVRVEAIREVKLPELNNEFAQSVGDYETLDELRDDIRAKLVETRNEAADRDVNNKIVNEIVSRSKVEFPDVLVSAEVSRELEAIRQDLEKEGRSFERYFEQIGKTRDQFLNELREEAARRIKVGLVLGELAEKEHIEVTEEEVEGEVGRMAADAKTTKDAVEAYLEPRGGRGSLANSLLNQKIGEFIKSVSTIKSGEVKVEST